MVTTIQSYLQDAVEEQSIQSYLQDAVEEQSSNCLPGNGCPVKLSVSKDMLIQSAVTEIERIFNYLNNLVL